MIAADDPRHGKNKGYIAGCREECCRTAHADYRRGLRTRQYLAGGALTVDGTGTRRRLQALMALGWSLQDVDRLLGKKITYCHNLLARDTDVILASTAAAIARVYDQLSMQLPVGDTGPRRQVISRQRNLARRKGWPPPLAWDDDRIDDPTHTPAGWEYVPAPRREALLELHDNGGTLADACRQLRISEASLQKWCGSNGLSHVYRALSARVTRHPNQYQEAS